MYNDSSSYSVIQTLRRLLRVENRMRVRSHGGSSLEMDYALRTFGIDVSSQLLRAENQDDMSYDDDDQSLEETSRSDSNERMNGESQKNVIATHPLRWHCSPIHKISLWDETRL